MRCGVASPGRGTKVSAFSIGWYTLLFWSYGKRFSVAVPACAGCDRAIVGSLRFRTARRVVLSLSAAFLALWLMESYEGPARRWAAMGVALAILLPMFVWEAFRPAPFEITPHPKTVVYEFTNGSYAQQFTELNGVARMPLVVVTRDVVPV